MLPRKYSPQVLRYRNLINYGLVAVATVALFALFIGFRNNTALVGALSAAGTVAAAGFAALAAFGSVRAANESSATARKAHEAMARNSRPKLSVRFTAAEGNLVGHIDCGPGATAVDLMVTWMLAEGAPVMEQRAQFGPGSTIAADLGVPETTSPADAVKLVWLQYWDSERVGQWQDTWQPTTEPGHEGVFALDSSRLVA